MPPWHGLVRAPTAAGPLAPTPLRHLSARDPQKHLAERRTARGGVRAALHCPPKRPRPRCPRPHLRRPAPCTLLPERRRSGYAVRAFSSSRPRRAAAERGLPDSSRAQAPSLYHCLYCTPVAPAAPVRPPKSARMNENVKIDYDTAEKVMDLDGCGLRHTAAPATPDARAGPRCTSKPSATRRL